MINLDSFWGTKTGSDKASKSTENIPSTIFCGFGGAFDSFREEEREETPQPAAATAAAGAASSSQRETASEADYSSYEDDDDSTVVSTSGASVLSIDYNNTDNIVEEGDKVDLSEIGDDDDESTLGDHEEVEGSNAIDENSKAHVPSRPSYELMERKRSSSSAMSVKRSSTGLSHSSQNVHKHSTSVKGNPSAEIERKDLLKNLKNNIATFGRYSLQVAETLKKLGAFHQNCGQNETSLTLYQESLDVFSAKLGDHNPKCVDLNVRLGKVTEDLGRENEALELYSRALFMILDFSGDENLTACDIRVNMSKIMFSKGFHKEAVKELKRALKGYREKHGDEHNSVADTVDLIADFYTESGQDIKANNVRGELVKLRVALHGAKSSEVATSLEKWAMTHDKIGDLNGALRIMKQSYVMFHDIEGTDGDNAVITLEKIGFLYSGMGRTEKAIRAHTSVALTRKNRYGENSVELAGSYLILGKAYMEDSKPERSLKALNRAMTCYGKANEANNGCILELMETLHTIGILHLKTSEYDKALKTFQKEMSLRQRYVGHDVFAMAKTFKSIGEAHNGLEHFSAGKGMFVQALQSIDRTDGRKLLFADTMAKCGEAFEGMNDESRAFTCYKESCQIFKANGCDETHPMMKNVVLKLLSMGLNDVMALEPGLRCSLIDGESEKFEM